MKLVSMKARTGLTVLALALALASAAAIPAFAQTGASATASFSHYELVDLDLSDGVTPWLSFTGPSTLWSYARIFPGSSDASPVAQSESWVGNMVEVHADGYKAWAQAGPSELSSFAGGGPNLVSSTALTRLDFLLSPNTGVTFFFDANLDTTGGESASLAIAGSKVTFGNDSFPLTEIDARDGERFSGYLTASGDVYGTDAVQGKLWATVYTETRAVSPVPEPAAPAMLLGGLGLLAAIRRRRVR
jgi:MYXO-CTERM domain-containing protein